MDKRGAWPINTIPTPHFCILSTKLDVVYPSLYRSWMGIKQLRKMGAVGGNFKKKLSNQLDEKTPSSQVARQLGKMMRHCLNKRRKKGASSSKLEMECVLCERSSSRIKISLTSWIGICFPPVGRFITDNKMATVGASHKLAQEPYSLLSLLLATY
jgi:hypothetical protein